MLHGFAYHVLHDLVVSIEQVVTAHPWLAGNARCNNNDVGVRGIGIILRTGHTRVALLDRHGFKQVQSLSLRHTFDNVDQDHVGQFFRSDPVCGRSTNVA